MRALALPLLLAAATACGDDRPSGPFDDIDLVRSVHRPELEANASVARDEFGIPHIRAENYHDLGFVQGYIMAHDRLPQMDILRRFGAGTLSELFGALQQDVVETDLEMRMHRMTYYATEAFAELKGSDDPVDQQMVEMLEGFAAGVNAYAEHLRIEVYELDRAVLFSFDPQRFEPWTPVDSLVLGRFQAFALSYLADTEIDITDLYQRAREVFDNAPTEEEDGYDEARDRRRGATRDLLRLQPIGRVATIDGFPHVDEDSGSRSDGSGSSARQGAAPPRRPHVPRDLLERARHFFRPKLPLGPHAFKAPRAGSNNWAVAPEHAGGKALLAGDQHLSLPNPPVFYPVHLTIPGELDIAGITFSGIPGVILGHNGKVAWQATVVAHDVADVYLEEIVPCDDGGGDCVVFDGGQVPIETREEIVEVGALGTITREKAVTYEWVPHHGPIVPTVADGEIVPRTGSQALSIKYTGHAVTHEFRAVFRMWKAESVRDVFAALSHWEYGAQNFVVIDNQGNIGWSTQARVPVREPEAYAFDPVEAPDGLAPFFILPGDGTAEWEGSLSPRYIPHAVNPEQGFLATANSDPLGVTFDGDPFNGPRVDGRPLYVGAQYAVGLRTERISELLADKIEAGDSLTLEDMAAIQRDTRSNVGLRLRPHLVDAIRLLEEETPPQPIADFAAGLDSGRVSRLLDAAERLEAWSLETPPAAGDSASEDEVVDSSATTIFNVWMHFYLSRAFGDELSALDWQVHSLMAEVISRIAVAVFEEPGSLASGLAPETGQPILCDDMSTDGAIESCDLVALQALDEALLWLEGSDGFGTEEMDDWRWGKLHTLTLEPLFPSDSLNVPPASDPDPLLRSGYPNAGDQYVVDAANPGWSDLDFSHSSGPAQRFLAEVEEGGTMRARMALPGGVVYDRSSPHYRDLMDEYYHPGGHFDIPYTVEEIVSAGEERWLFLAR